ncbi:hypothetical protein JMJ77_0000605 [Colletotrichum scovillei]|uniref:Uncharacterized protein n=1 Tax=Colletotrichum scovillei TaxID=1209932 RepID=A0A9P7RBE8_9PEZI|nr:hypothetical protein JMJ77_0000605 [Colletotrichum scovillei]KAG7071814.1 hypothetical protein JMJ76_0004681 [Colletotrichum scovillei]KAG7080092.1 hypothetical protein JMJ78_0007194 [Colletotrichum scovillei]
MDSNAGKSVCHSGSERKSAHTHSTAASQRSLPSQQLSAYQNQAPSEDSNLYRVAYQNTDTGASVAQHRGRIVADLDEFTGRFDGSSS